MKASCSNLESLNLPDGNKCFLGTLSDQLVWNPDKFQKAWQLAPKQRHMVRIGPRWTELPRAVQAYGKDYSYTGALSRAQPIPKLLWPLLEFAQEEISHALNGLLLNFYSGPTEYIGPHHDSTKGLVSNSPIVTISFGETRMFRFEQGRGTNKQKIDLLVEHGDLLVIPWETNKAWKHSVPKRARYHGRRISVTIRAFQ